MDIVVTMTENEIVDAIKNYMNDQDIVTLGKNIEVNLVAGRGPNGHSAVITIKKDGDTQNATPNPAPATTPAPTRQTKKADPAKAKPEPEPVVQAPVVLPGEEEVVEAPPATEQVTDLFADAGEAGVPDPAVELDENTVTEGSTEEVESLFS